jgi:hypothetical protein
MDQKRRRITCPSCHRSPPEVLQDEQDQIQRSCALCCDTMGTVHALLHHWLAAGRPSHPPTPKEETSRIDHMLEELNDEWESETTTTPFTYDICNICEQLTVLVHAGHPTGAQCRNCLAILVQEGIDNDPEHITESIMPGLNASSSSDHPPTPQPCASDDIRRGAGPYPIRSTAVMDYDPQTNTSTHIATIAPPDPTPGSSSDTIQPLPPHRADEPTDRMAWHTSGTNAKIHTKRSCSKHRGDWQKIHPLI